MYTSKTFKPGGGDGERKALVVVVGDSKSAARKEATYSRLIRSIKDHMSNKAIRKAKFALENKVNPQEGTQNDPHRNREQ